MKKLFYLLVLVSGFAFGQDYPKDAVELLVGKELKVLPNLELPKEGYYNFYKKKDFELSYNNRLKAKYDVFNGAIFKLISFDRNAGSQKDEIILELKNDKIGTVFYGYDPKFIGSWIFEIIGGIQYPDRYWCKDIVEKGDKFTGKTTYTSPTDNHVWFLKDKDGIYISLESHGKTININQKGIIILLKDGSKIENNTAKIDVKVDGDGWYTYSTFFQLTPDEIKKLTTTYIADYRLFVYDFKLDNGSLFQEYLNCLTKL